ncbi:DUF4880 domain-containing protein [Pigmentiphaga aceris]|uniref:DUF4880 domain-containing protein n=1 Tax=Pigmentiphaga aceris TaxID=1940612 RepID=A0A5C0B3Y8_9BURK|nr:FecR domain-containing protein [Pigmentiphaga aceris]QEI07511.1 DUF4880 domain-containing protein [Pigmentiphaga aceris]
MRQASSPFARSDASSAPVPRQVVEEAAAFFVRLQADADNAALAAQCANWRAAHPHHESAWQRVCGLLQLQPAGAPLFAPAARLALERTASGRERRKLLVYLFAIGGSAALAWSVDAPTRLRTRLADHRTDTGETRELTLADGTLLTLASQTSVNVDVSGPIRSIRLFAGEVMVRTGIDPQRRPLVLTTRFGSVTPIGTRFSVRDTEIEAVRVQLFEGVVELRATPDAAPVLLQAGQQARLTATGPQDINALRAGSDAWTQGTLVAERMPLGECIAELARYRPGIVRCAPSVAPRLISGAFPLQRSDQAFEMIARVLQVQVIYRTRYWVSIEA